MPASCRRHASHEPVSDGNRPLSQGLHCSAGWRGSPLHLKGQQLQESCYTKMCCDCLPAAVHDQALLGRHGGRRHAGAARRWCCAGATTRQLLAAPAKARPAKQEHPTGKPLHTTPMHLGQPLQQVGIIDDGLLFLLHAAGGPCAAQHLHSHGGFAPLGQVDPPEGALPDLLLHLQVSPVDLQEAGAQHQMKHSGSEQPSQAHSC